MVKPDSPGRPHRPGRLAFGPLQPLTASLEGCDWARKQFALGSASARSPPKCWPRVDHLGKRRYLGRLWGDFDEIRTEIEAGKFAICFGP